MCCNGYYCRSHVRTMCASCSLDCVLLTLNVFMAIFGCTCMCHPHFLVSALYFFVHARYRAVQGGFMGIFRFIRTWQINGNLGGARVTAPKILISNPKTMHCNGASTQILCVRLIVMLWRSLDGMFPQLHGLGGDLVLPSPLYIHKARRTPYR